MSTKTIASIQTVVIFPRNSSQYKFAYEFLERELLKCQVEKNPFDSTGLILLKLLVNNFKDPDISKILPLVPNVHEMEFESAQYRELEKIFFIDTGRTRVLDKYKCFEGGQDMLRDGFFNQEFFLYFSDILESPQNYNKQVKAFALNALLQTFYGQKSDEVINGPRDVSEIKKSIEDHLSSTSLKHSRSNDVTRITALVRCWCKSKLRGHSIDNIFNIVQNIVKHYDALLTLDDHLIELLRDDRSIIDDFLQYLIDTNFTIKEMTNWLSMVNAINRSIPLTEENKNLSTDFFQLFQELMHLDRFAFSDIEKLAISVVDNFKAGVEYERSINAAINSYNTSHPTPKLLNVHQAQPGMKRIAGRILDLWIKYNFQFAYYPLVTEFLLSCREIKGEKFKGEKLQPVISHVQRFTREIDPELRHAIYSCLASLVGSLIAIEDFKPRLESIKNIFRTLTIVPTEALDILRTNRELVSKNCNDIVAQISLASKLVPAELLLALTYLRNQLHSVQISTRVSARNIAELYDLPLKLSLMLSLSIDGVTDPRNKGGKVDGMVIFLGLTGSGKSTTINYLTGTEYFLREYRAKYSLEEVPNQARSATRVGFSGKSATLYPHVVYGTNGLNLADCPGFEDNRESNASAVCRFAVPLAVYYARQITAVAVTVEWDSCNPEVGGRGSMLRNLSVILGNIFKGKVEDLAKSALMIVVTKLPDLTLGKSIETIREYFLSNVSDILNGQKDNRYLEIGKLEAQLARLSVQINSRIAHGKPENAAEIKRRSEFQNSLNDLRNEKAMLELIASGKHKIFFMRPSEADCRQEFLDHVKYLQDEKHFVPHSCFSFDPSSSNFRHINQIVDEVVSKRKDMVSGLIRFYTESVTAEQKVQDQFGVIEQERSLFSSILKGDSVGERDQIIQSKLTQNIDEQKNVIATLNKSTNEINDNIANEERNRAIINSMPMVEYGSAIKCAEVYSIVSVVSQKTGISTWLSPWSRYTFPQTSWKNPIPIEKIELSCVIDDDYSCEKPDFRVIVYQEPLSPQQENLAKIVTVDKNSNELQALKTSDENYPGVDIVTAQPASSQETGYFDILACDLKNGIFKAFYHRTSDLFKSRSVRAFVLPKHLPEYRKALATIDGLITDFLFKVSRNNLDVERANRIIADCLYRLSVLQGGLGDNQAYKLDLLYNCMQKLDISCAHVIENYFPQLTKDDCIWLKSSSNFTQLKRLPFVSDAYKEFWKALGMTRAELEVHFRGFEEADNGSHFDIEFLRNCVPILKHLISCCISTGLSILSVHHILTNSGDKKRSEESHFALLRERQIGKYVSNFVHCQLIKDFVSHRRELTSTKILLELFKFNGAVDVDNDRCVFLENLNDIESRQLHAKSFKPLALNDVQSVIKTLKLLPDNKRIIIMKDLMPYNLKYDAMLDQNSMPAINALIAHTPDPLDQSSASQIELFSGVDSTLVTKFINDTKTELVSSEKASVPTIIVFGLSGCGKSTVIKHLSGIEYVNDDINHNRLRAVYSSGDSYSSSEFQIPISYLLECPGNPWNNIVMCECPHMVSKTNETLQLCGDLCIPLILSEVSIVKSILLVIDYNDIFLQRGKNFGQLFSFVKDRFQMQPSTTLHKSIFYVFTKVPAEETKETLCAKLQNLFLSDKKVGDAADAEISIEEWTMRLVLLLVLNLDQIEIFYNNGAPFATSMLPKLFTAPEIKYCNSISNQLGSIPLQSIINGVSTIVANFESVSKSISSGLEVLKQTSEKYTRAMSRISSTLNAESSGLQSAALYDSACLASLNNSIQQLRNQKMELSKAAELLTGEEEINFASYEHPATSMWFYTSLKYSLLGMVNMATFAAGSLPIPFIHSAMSGLGSLASIGLDHSFHDLISVKIQHKIGFNAYRVECETLHGTVKTRETDIVDGQYDAVFHPSPYLIDLTNAKIEFHKEDIARLRFFAKKTDVNSNELTMLQEKQAKIDESIAELQQTYQRTQDVMKASAEKNTQSMLNVLEEEVVTLRNSINELLQSVSDNFNYLDYIWGEATTEKRWFYFIQSLLQALRLDVVEVIPNFSANLYEKVDEFRARSSGEFDIIVERNNEEEDEEEEVSSPERSTRERSSSNANSTRGSVRLGAVEIHLPSESDDRKSL